LPYLWQDGDALLDAMSAAEIKGSEC
jgi:hypothetical protein